MMEEEEETLFDQEGLLGSRDEPAQEKKNWKRKMLKTTALSMSFFCLGLCISIPGPTLMDLGQRVGKDTEHMVLIFTARSIGYLVGALVGGVLFDFFDQQILLFYTLGATAVATTFVPWCTALLILAIAIGVQGLAMGVLDTGGNVFCIKIWGKQSASYMQMLHFCFGVGAFLAPLLARPFLNDYFIALSNESSVVDYHPVNTKLNSLSSLSDGQRFVRDLHEFAIFKHDEDNLAHLPEFRFRRNVNTTESNLGVNGSEVTSLNQTNNVTGQVAVTPVPTERPKKPSVINSHSLSAEHADAEVVNDKLKALKEPPVVPDNSVTNSPSTLAPTNATELDVNGNNSTVNGTEQSLNGLFVDNGDSTIGEVVTTPSTTISSTTTTTTPTTPTTPSTTTASTTTSSTTTTTTTTSTTPQAPFNPVTPTPITPGNQPSGPDEKPVEKPEEALDITPTSSNTTGNDTLDDKQDTWGSYAEYMLHKLKNMSRIQFAYLIVGLLLLLNAGAFLFLYCKDQAAHYRLDGLSQEDLARPPDPRWYVISLLMLLFIFFFIYVGMEVSFGGLITTFAVEYPNIIWTESQGATLAAIFWGSIAMGRGFAIFFAKCFKPPCMMVGNLILTVGGALILSFGIFASSALLWVGTLVIGLGMSSVFPSAVSWADSYYPLTGKAAAVFIAGSGIGEMTLPLLTGVLYDKLSPMALMYSTLILSCLLSVVFAAMQVVACKKQTINPRRSHSGFMRLETSEDLADDMDMDMLDVSETVIRRRSNGQKQEDKLPKQNGATHEESEFTKLVELSD